MSEAKTKTKFLSIDQIKKAQDLETVEVYIPEWKGAVLIRPFTLKERGEVRKRSGQQKQDPDGNWTTEYDAEEMEIESILAGVRNPDDPSQKLFGREDRAWLLGEKSSGALSKISKAILDASGMGGDAVGKPDES